MNGFCAPCLDERRIANPHAGGVPAKLDAEGVGVPHVLVWDDHDATLAQYRDRNGDGLFGSLGTAASGVAWLVSPDRKSVV